MIDDGPQEASATTTAEPDPAPATLAEPRELRDPAELRALAHPVRLAILELLITNGPSTATELAEQLGDESPANCSWHLRQLNRYGFIEEAGTGPGRQRRWRVIPQPTSFGPTSDDTPELTHAIDAADEVMLGREIAVLRAWQSTRRDEPEQWRDASFALNSHAWLTADEMAAFQTEFKELLARHSIPQADRLDPATRPAGARHVRLVTWLIPHQPVHSPGPDPDHPERVTPRNTEDR
ncbi:winged helix-turn-helix domain-containing protein [Phytoactinopolyspora limicola]|uniref:winged helix-turn-helix domain-containing protein n=1 Tax=Phytoactinopolyspora limicola TaxID=2715536 RepID=UPI00140A3C9E|nr:helix-turn-helix domain-containing protein [Phytoactinopolyspora limicola]